MLEGGKTLLRSGRFEFQSRHLLVIAVLAIAFTTAFIIRSYPVKYGFYLNEFDPYFDYRATKYIVDHGLNAYWKWHDTMSWFPEGRNVPQTSQSGLHIVSAFLYEVFGFGSSLLDFIIILPVILGSLTTIIVFALVRVLSGSTAGMFSALLFAFSPAVIQRGNLGWFKSEPLGLFFALLSLYLFLSAFKQKELRYSLLKAGAAGVILGLANASWGGVQYFSIPIAIFFIALPYFRKDLKFPMYIAITFTILTLASTLAFPRPGISFVLGFPGIALIGSTIFLIIAKFVRQLSKPRTEIRNLLFLLVGFIIVSTAVYSAGKIYSPSFRYLNAINPFLSSQNALVESVAEHFTPTLVDYFTDYSLLLMFAGLGAWIAFKRRHDMSIFALILGFTAIYVSATFARLLVFASIGILVLAGLGLYEVTRSILEYRESTGASATSKTKTKKKFERSRKQPISGVVRISYIVIIIFMLTIPLIYPANSNWRISADVPPSIANGGTGYRLQTNDWLDALNWLSKNTAKDSVIASWWDYGYWITTLGNRTSLADNATINQTRIATIAKMFIDQKEEGVKVSHDLKADYILIYVVGQRFSGINGTSFYMLGNGGDESKKQWFIKIGGFDPQTYLQQDGFTPTPLFWNTTLLGQLIPFTPQAYASFRGGALTNLQPQYQPGTIAIYSKDIKYPLDNQSNHRPLSLVYSSPSFTNNNPGLVFGVLIYKVNHDYNPTTTIPSGSRNNTEVASAAASTPHSNITRAASSTNPTPSSKVGIIDTAQGIIKVEFFPNVAPRHVENFENLANKGFYNGTIFHRIVKNFVIQAGDPNTKYNSTPRDKWGTGDPGFSLQAEFSDIPHKRGILSMARSSDPNSAGSQFFIVLNDSSFLDKQYTVFGRVIEGMNVADKIAALPTNQDDQPLDPNSARIKSIKIEQKQ